ncbi:MAG: biotin/lipoyl-binding protein [Burkholderiales bacterium]|nr:biotin/lipoyl-binding protein [Burkholderiales bacterium]
MGFHKIIIANRGEIACRVIRTARALGYRTVAVYSDADAAAPHVALADEAVRIGPAPAAESYLHIPALLDAVRRTGADAVHPGYGFLSERPEFAAACVQAGLVFIGPPAEAMAAMGDKAAAKRRMQQAGVPCAPGYLPSGTDDQDDARLVQEAQRLGVPLLVKAVAGGGGRGMRLVQALDELPAALAAARREAAAAFGDDRLMLERLVMDARHVEVQVFADTHGDAVHLGERDCTAQRRRQKVIEEAPSPIVDATLRERLGRDAVAAALAVGYVGAGTVEFVVDAAGQHFFLEMNTRLQVEHPVTEILTGFDLVAWQLRVAAGEPLRAWLPNGQADVRWRGHAIEARLYAEDPFDGFTPQTGAVAHWRPGTALAAAGGSLRIDAGITEGSTVSPWYDPMLAKLIVHGHDRADAIRRLVAALDDSPVFGLATNARFLRGLLQHDDFTHARMTTTCLDEWATRGEPLLRRPEPPEALWLAAAALAARGGLPAGTPEPLRPAAMAAVPLRLRCQGAERAWRARWLGDAVQLLPADAPRGGAPATVRVLAHDAEAARWRLEIDGVAACHVARSAGDGGWWLAHEAAVYRFDQPSPWPDARRAADPRRACATVAGRVAQVAVRPGQRVAAGDPLASVEAMKMEMWQHAAAAGTVRAVHVAAGDAVAAGTLLVELNLEEDTPA